MASSPRLTLYHHWRSSASWRVRWALALKQVPCEYVHVNIATGETDRPEHLARSPLGTVPVLSVDGKLLLESLAMIEWLEELHPQPALLPRDPFRRALARQFAELVNAGIHPLQNLPAQELHSSDPAERKRWATHWITEGLGAYEKLARPLAGRFTLGDELTLADVCLIPQLYNARRLEIDLAPFPTLARIREAALATEACQASLPERFQPPG